MGTGCGSPHWATDGYCDDENNNADCNYDGGACCFNDFSGYDYYCKDCEFWNAHHLDGMEITIVMTFSIPEIVNTTGEIAAVTTCLLPTAMIVHALILKPKPGQRLTSTNLKTNTVHVSSFGQK